MGMGPAVVSVVGTVRLILLQYSIVNTFESFSLFHLLLYPDLYLLGDVTSIN